MAMPESRLQVGLKYIRLPHNATLFQADPMDSSLPKRNLCTMRRLNALTVSSTSGKHGVGKRSIYGIWSPAAIGLPENTPFSVNSESSYASKDEQ